MNFETVTNYEILKDYYLSDMQSQATLLKHKKTGAYIALLSNQDENKVFNIAFRTPVSDDTGVPHIIEHTVLCGSDKYPVKDPFIELAKGSLNTFLNAMTYPDKTVYPVASCNDKDFRNLVDIYMDAVLHPRIYREEKIFKQEGWHYELDSLEGELTYNGVVYNEMKGAFSSVDGILDRRVMHSLFPDTGYGFESGGNPENIPELTYENYLDFHSKYYHPSNSLIYLYGNMDMVEYLEYLDREYLSKYDYLEIDSTIKIQKPFEKMNVDRCEIPLSDGESEDSKCVLSYNMVVGSVLDKYTDKAIRALDYVLMDMPGAPLKQALLDANLGSDVYSVYEDGILQPFYSYVVRNADEKNAKLLKQVVDEKLCEIAKKGVDSAAIEAWINNSEFKYREGDSGRYPKGLILGLDMLDSWLYDKKEAFLKLEDLEVYDFLRSKLNTDYFKEIIKKYFIGNNHSSMVVLVPKKGLAAKNEEAQKKQLEQIKKSMTKEELEKIISDTKDLKKYQSTPSTPEELKVIPMLTIEDIDKNPKPIMADRKDICGIEAVHHNYETNGIGYLSMVFKDKYIPQELIPYIGLMKLLMTYMDTQDYGYTELNNKINMYTGAIVVDQVIHSTRNGDYIPTVEVNIKALFDKMPEAFKLTESIMFRTKFTDYKRMLEIIREAKSNLQNAIVSAGNSIAALRAHSYYSEQHYFKEQYAGISFYKFIEDLEKNFQEKKEDVARKLECLTKYIFRPENMIISYTCNKEHYLGIEKEIAEIKNHLYTGDIDTSCLKSTKPLEFKVNKKNEGLKTPSQVQYVVRAGNFLNKGLEFQGRLFVLRHILSYEYMWNKIRELGGAYGCGANFTVSGDGLFYSYRDPKLKETNQVYETIPDYVSNFDCDDRAMTKFVIGTISGMDTPLFPADLGARSFNMYITGTTMEMLKKNRSDVLSANVEAIRSCRPYVDALLDENCLCVVGNENKIDQEKEIFETVYNVFGD